LAQTETQGKEEEIMNLKKRIKEIIFQLTHDPNSAAGLRHRADKLVAEGTNSNSPYVTMLRKRAYLMESENNVSY